MSDEVVKVIQPQVTEMSIIEKKIDMDLTEVESGKKEIQEQVDQLKVIESDAEAQLAGLTVQRVKNVMAAIDLKFLPYETVVANVKRKADEVRTSIANTKAFCKTDWLAMDKILRDSALAWKQKEDLRLAEEKRAAEKKAQDERLNTAVKLEEKGFSKAAEEILSLPASPLKGFSGPKIAGMSFRTTWDYKATEEPLDPAYTTKDSRGFTVPDHTKIRSEVTAKKGETKIKGVSVYSNTGTSV